MSNFGKVMHMDLTVPNADEVRDFYQAVAGWSSTPLSMGDYDDYVMMDAEGNPVSGICHKRGENSNVPSQWLIYITVPDMDASVAACKERGGTVVEGPRMMGDSRFCVVQDPAGAVAALIEFNTEGEGQA